MCVLPTLLKIVSQSWMRILGESDVWIPPAHFCVVAALVIDWGRIKK